MAENVPEALASGRGPGLERPCSPTGLGGDAGLLQILALGGAARPIPTFTTLALSSVSPEGTSCLLSLPHGRLVSGARR